MRPRERYRFGPFELDVGERELRRAGASVALKPKVFDLLVALVRRAGQLVSKEELLQEVWPDTTVGDASLSQAVWLLRRALGAEGETALVATVPKAGYRFAAPIEVAVDPPAAPGLAAATPSPPPSGPGSPPPPSAVPRRRVLGLDRGGLVVAAAGLVVAALVVGVASRRWRPAAVEPAPGGARRLAALAFSDLGPPGGEAWLGTALPELVATELAAEGALLRLPDEAVGRAEQEGGAGGALDGVSLRSLASRLHADYLLTGSYLVVGDGDERRVRVQAAVLDGARGVSLASFRETIRESELPELAVRAGAELRAGLGLPAVAGGSLTRAGLPADPEAQRLYFEGLARSRRLDSVAAREVLARAVAIEPGSPLARAALASTLSVLGEAEPAREQAEAALALAGVLPAEQRLWIEARALQAQRRWQEAVARFEKLFSLHPAQLDYGLELASAQVNAGHGDEALVTVARLRQLPPALAADGRVDLAEARAAQQTGDLQRLAVAAERAIEKGRASGARLLLSRAHGLRASARLDLGQVEAAAEDYQAMRRVGEEAGSPVDVAYARNGLALVARRRDLNEEAREHYDEAIAAFRRAGDRRGEANSLVNLGNLLSDLGAFGAAREAYELGIARHLENGMPDRAAASLGNLGRMESELGNRTRGYDLHREAVVLLRPSASKATLVTFLTNLAQEAVMQGEVDAAAALLTEAEPLAEASGSKLHLARLLTAKGYLALHRGELEAARALLADACRLKAESGDPVVALGCELTYLPVLLDLGEAGEACTRAEATAAERASEERPSDAARTEILIARCHLAQGRTGDAEAALAHARQGVPAEAGPLGWVGSSLALAEAELALALHQPARARAAVGPLLAAAEAQAARTLAFEARLVLARAELCCGDEEVGERLLAAIAADAEQADLGRYTLLAAREMSGK